MLFPSSAGVSGEWFRLLDLLGTAAKSDYQAGAWFRAELALVITAVVFGALGLRAATGSRALSRQV